MDLASSASFYPHHRIAIMWESPVEPTEKAILYIFTVNVGICGYRLELLLIAGICILQDGSQVRGKQAPGTAELTAGFGNQVGPQLGIAKGGILPMQNRVGNLTPAVVGRSSNGGNGPLFQAQHGQGVLVGMAIRRCVQYYVQQVTVEFVGRLGSATGAMGRRKRVAVRVGSLTYVAWCDALDGTQCRQVALGLATKDAHFVRLVPAQAAVFFLAKTRCVLVLLILFFAKVHVTTRTFAGRYGCSCVCLFGLLLLFGDGGCFKF